MERSGWMEKVKMVEHMVMPNLIKKFREMGFMFTKAYPHATIEDEENNIIMGKVHRIPP
jgi:hypothetical protein